MGEGSQSREEAQVDGLPSLHSSCGSGHRVCFRSALSRLPFKPVASSSHTHSISEFTACFGLHRLF